MKPTLISSQPKLTDAQIQIVDILKETLAQALEGKINTIGIIVCFDNGFASVMGGTMAGALNLGCDDLKAKILGAVVGAGEKRVQNATVSNIIKPRGH
jgi:hypothetical protein